MPMWERFLNGQTAIHCNTEAEALDLMDILHEFNIVWHSALKLTKRSFYEKHRDNTCYSIAYVRKLYYGHIDEYREKNYEIVEFIDMEFEYLE